MAEKSKVFEQTYEDYLSRIAELDFSFIADTLGIKVDGDEAVVPFFGKPYRVSKKAITDPDGKQPHLSICVILCKYLLMCPLIEPLGGNWMAFKDFKDAAPLIQAFSNTVTRAIAEAHRHRKPLPLAASRTCFSEASSGYSAMSRNSMFGARSERSDMILYTSPSAKGG